MSESCSRRREACVRPCRACPWRKDAHAAEIPGFDLELAENLAATSRTEQGFGPEFGAPLFACHESTEGDEIICASWLAIEGTAHPNVRLMVIQGAIDVEQLSPDPSWPDLHESFVAMIDKLRDQVV